MRTGRFFLGTRMRAGARVRASINARLQSAPEKQRQASRKISGAVVVFYSTGIKEEDAAAAAFLRLAFEKITKRSLTSSQTTGRDFAFRPVSYFPRAATVFIPGADKYRVHIPRRLTTI